MPERGLLNGKKVLVVDDEPDILTTLENLLDMCVVVKASTFGEAKDRLESEPFHIAVLDIMGVDGFALLEIAKGKGVLAVMLTAHADSVENTKRAIQEGAASYIPKEEIGGVVAFLNDVLEARERGRSSWWRWMDRLETYYNRKYGTDWQKSDEEFWRKFPQHV